MILLVENDFSINNSRESSINNLLNNTNKDNDNEDILINNKFELRA